MPRGVPREQHQRRDAAAGHDRKRRLRDAEPLKPRRQVVDPGALRRPTQPVTQGDHRGQRHDDRRHASVSDERAVQRAECGANRTRDQAGGGRRQASLGRHAGDDAAGGKCGSDRDVDLAGEDDQRRADRDDQDRQVDQKQVAEILDREIRRRDDGQRDRQRDERDRRRPFTPHGRAPTP